MIRCNTNSQTRGRRRRRAVRSSSWVFCHTRGRWRAGRCYGDTSERRRRTWGFQKRSWWRRCSLWDSCCTYRRGMPADRNSFCRRWRAGGFDSSCCYSGIQRPRCSSAPGGDDARGSQGAGCSTSSNRSRGLRFCKRSWRRRGSSDSSCRSRRARRRRRNGSLCGRSRHRGNSSWRGWKASSPARR